MESSSSQLKRVVVVGLGHRRVSGLEASPYAGRTFEIVGIDARKAFWHTFGTPRAVANESYANKFVIPYDNLIRHGRVLTETHVVEVAHDKVTTHTGERVPYDYLVLATGSSYRGFIKAESGIDAALAHMKAIRDTATKPNSKVAIVGAGLSGVEFAGELKTAFPHAHVTLVDSNPTVVASYPKDEVSLGFRSDLENKLRHLGVELIFNERIIIPQDRFDTVQPRTLKFESGKVIETDAQIFTIGSPKPNSSVFQKGLLSSAVDSVTGQFKVNEFVQVQGFEHIFAIGDVSNTPVVKSALRARFEGEFLSKHLIEILTNPQPTLKPFKVEPAYLVAFVNMNATTGAIMGLPFKGWSMTGIFGNLISRFKGSDVFLGRFSKNLNHQVEE